MQAGTSAQSCLAGCACDGEAASAPGGLHRDQRQRLAWVRARESPSPVVANTRSPASCCRHCHPACGLGQRWSPAGLAGWRVGGFGLVLMWLLIAPASAPRHAPPPPSDPAARAALMIAVATRAGRLPLLGALLVRGGAPARRHQVLRSLAISADLWHYLATTAGQYGQFGLLTVVITLLRSDRHHQALLWKISPNKASDH